MKRIIIFVFFFISSFVFSEEKTTLAILGFVNKGDKSDNYYNSMISTSLSSFLSKLKELKVLPYSEVTKVVSNQGLLDKKELDINLALDTGVMLGANQVLIGDYLVNKKDKEININFYIYDVITGKLKLQRSYKGKTDLDFFDTMDRMVSIVGSLLLARPIFLGKLFVEIDSEDEYLIYINDSFQKKVSKIVSFSDSVLAEENFILSLKKSKTMEEVYRGEIFVKNNQTYYFKYSPYGSIKISGKGFKGATIYTNEAFYGTLPDSEESIISNIMSGIEYNIYLKKDDFISEKKKIKIEEGKTSLLDFTINKARRVKIPLDGKTPSISMWNITGYAMVGIGLIGIGTGYYFNLEAKSFYEMAAQKYDEYLNATSDVDTKEKEYRDVVSKLNTSVLVRNISYISGGVLLGTGLILSFFPFKSEDKKISFEILPNYVEIGYRF